MLSLSRGDRPRLVFLGRSRTKGAPAVLAVQALFISCMVSGCARNAARIRQHFERDAFEKATKLSSGNHRMENALAVWIIEAAAAEDTRSMQAVDLLKRAGSDGKEALERLASRDDLSGRLARVALSDKGPPDDTVRDSCENDPHGDVRSACLREHHQTLPLSLLKRRMLDTDPRVRQYAIMGIKHIETDGVEATELLTEALRQDPASKVRAEAAAAGRRLGADAYLLLKNALDDPNQGVRLAALKGIADLGFLETLDRSGHAPGHLCEGFEGPR